ncbi:MAG TPA: endonuclease/exonuclease/phosphatase family protein [Gemmatimonadales bacterium]|nr:endonuclease/exonuclease/phosphatase family protein [Gemmatimonadales bacterium]
MTLQRSVIAAVILLTAACNDSPFEAALWSDGNRLSEQRVSSPSADITVMSQNLYVGADVDLVIRALATPDPSDDLPALLFAIETLGTTAYPARVEAIADQIARARPHAVGLQEVSEINIDLRPLGMPVFVSQDFLALLQDALTRRGLHYTVAGTSDNINVSLVGGLVSLFDHDVLLVDTDRVTVNAASGQVFAVNLGPVAPGVSLIRGWVWAQTTVDGEAYTFATAHTEANLAGAPPGLVESVRAAQVGEMVATLASSERVIVIGDLNDQPGSPMYNVLTGSGYTDSWAALHPGAQGLTCCHNADLADAVAGFDQRIDYIFTRGFARADGKLFGQVDRFGDVPADRLAGPSSRIWPSDHAGLVAALR